MDIAKFKEAPTSTSRSPASNFYNTCSFTPKHMRFLRILDALTSLEGFFFSRHDEWKALENT
jgi:hypothetical protein